MRKGRGVLLAIAAVTAAATLLWRAADAVADQTARTDDYRVESPDGRISVELGLSTTGQPQYTVSFDGAVVVEASPLGLYFASRVNLVSGMRIDRADRRSVDQSWEQPWGERRVVRDRFNELTLSLSARGPDRRYRLRFRVYDDGLGFRYEVPEQDAYREITLTGETTAFRVSRDARAFSQPADAELRYEELYTESALGLLDRVSSPLALRLPSGVHLAIHARRSARN